MASQTGTRRSRAVTGWISAVDPKIVLAFTIIYVIWGSTYLAIRYAIEGIPPFLMAGMRFTIAGLLLFGWSWLQNMRLPGMGQWKSALIGGVLMFALSHGGLVWAEQRLPSGMAALILALTPALILLVDWLRPGGARPAGTHLIGLLVGFVGLVILVDPGSSVGARLDLPSALVLVFAGLAWAVGTVYTKHGPSSGPASLTASMELLSGGVILLLLASARGDWSLILSRGVPLRSILALAYLIVFGSLIAFNAYVWLLGVSSPSKVSTYAYVNPVIAIILGWAVASEPISLRTMVASAIILLSVVVITRHRTKEE